MGKGISFNESVKAIDHQGNISFEKISNSNSIITRTSRNKKGGRFYFYTQPRANAVGGRIEKEVSDFNKLDKRLQQECVVENLLVKNRCFGPVNKIYRLSDDALVLMTKRLLVSK